MTLLQRRRGTRGDAMRQIIHNRLSRRRFTLSVAAAAAMSLSALLPAPAAHAQQRAPAAQAAEKPDMVIMLADDLGLLDTGAYGNREVRTPNIDRLAQEGQTYDRAFVASPACAPSRGALLTGLMPARNGAEPNHGAVHSWVKKMPAYLQEQGYQVVSFGKVAHYEQVKQYGFDHYEHFTFHDDEAVEAAVRWLKERDDPRPLALFVGSNWPHVPWPKTTEGYDPDAVSLPEKSIDTPVTRDARARFYAAVSRLDTEVGKVLDASEAILGDDTFYLFTSDHGTQWPFGKWNLYDTGTQVPMIVRWPGATQPGSRTDAMVSWVDILPTLVDVAGGEAPDDLDGRSFIPVVRGETDEARSEIFTTHTNDGKVNVFPMRSIRTDRWKYIRNQHPDWVYTTHIDQFGKRVDSGAYFLSWVDAAETDARAKEIVDDYYNRPAEELYDLQADPAEKRNLADDPRYADVLKDLRSRLDAWQTQQGDTMRLHAPPHLTREQTVTK